MGANVSNNAEPAEETNEMATENPAEKHGNPETKGKDERRLWYLQKELQEYKRKEKEEEELREGKRMRDTAWKRKREVDRWHREVCCKIDEEWRIQRMLAITHGQPAKSDGPSTS